MNKGIIKITSQLYNERYDVIGSIFKEVKPLKIDVEYWKYNDFVIYCESNLFDEVKDGEIIPEYIVEITENEDKTYLFKFIKI